VLDLFPEPPHGRPRKLKQRDSRFLVLFDHFAITPSRATSANLVASRAA